METITSGKRKANKAHICDFCGGEIKNGEEYEHQTNKYEGELYEWKAHVKCTKLANHYSMYDYCDEGLNRDDFMDQIHDVFDGEFTLHEKIDLLYNKINVTE